MKWKFSDVSPKFLKSHSETPRPRHICEVMLRLNGVLPWTTLLKGGGSASVDTILSTVHETV